MSRDDSRDPMGALLASAIDLLCAMNGMPTPQAQTPLLDMADELFAAALKVREQAKFEHVMSFSYYLDSEEWGLRCSCGWSSTEMGSFVRAEAEARRHMNGVGR